MRSGVGTPPAARLSLSGSTLDVPPGGWLGGRVLTGERRRVLQVYFKREDSPELAPYERRLREIATALAAAPAAHPHVWPFQRVLQVRAVG
jgi:hypothetical protein